MTSARIKGKALTLTLDGTNYAVDVNECSIEPDEKDSDNLTFGDLVEGIKSGLMKLTAIQSTATGSLWRMIWDNSGSDVPFIMAPHGNNVATAAEPHITGKVTIGLFPKIGGKVGPKDSYMFDTEWSCTVDPLLKTSGTAVPASGGSGA